MMVSYDGFFLNFRALGYNSRNGPLISSLSPRMLFMYSGQVTFESISINFESICKYLCTEMFVFHMILINICNIVYLQNNSIQVSGHLCDISLLMKTATKEKKGLLKYFILHF